MNRYKYTNRIPGREYLFQDIFRGQKLKAIGLYFRPYKYSMITIVGIEDSSQGKLFHVLGPKRKRYQLVHSDHVTNRDIYTPYE